MIMNRIQVEDIRFRSEHCKATNQDCKDLLDYIDTLSGDMDCEGSLLEKITDNLRDFIDIDYEVCIDKKRLAAYISRNK
jgi:hypothetical protein